MLNFAQIPERRMHLIRWILTIGWLGIIASLFYDPWTAVLTEPNHPWSPLRLPSECIKVQGQCLVEQPYPLGTTLFWGAIVPSAIFILLVFGHEVWRRICPLSFLSQIPRALGWQRQLKRENAKTGKVRYELAKVKADSWLGKNYPYVQFAWLFVGLCGRILFFNADRLILALWLLFTIACAVTVGYLYGGKSWCQYFCPMAPVQRVFSEPAGLLSSQAHTSEEKITQSMCRTVLPDGEEQSACVACQNPCIDIDSERAYWDGLNKPEESFLRYGYVGLVIGYFVYSYLYAGNWDYYFSGAWIRDTDQLASLLNPGFYLFGQVINIPKLFAVPLTLGVTTFVGYQLGPWLEKQAKAYSRARALKLTPEILRHRVFTICTFGIFNFFFVFAGRPLVRLLPLWVQYIYDLSLITLSTLWLHRTWYRTPELYSRENLAGRFRKQLDKLQINFAELLEGRSLNDLNTHEIYILARVLPGFTKEKRHEAYKGVVREVLEEGYVNYSSSLEVLQQLRQELGIKDDEHRKVLEELGVEDPELFNPNRPRSLENQIRLTGYRKSLERLMVLQQKQLDENDPEILALRRQYSITTQEENSILEGISPEAANLRRGEFLLAQLPPLIACYHGLHQGILNDHKPVLMLLQDSIHHKKSLIVQTILEILEKLPSEPEAIALAQSLGNLAPLTLVELLAEKTWQDRLTVEILDSLNPLQRQSISCSLDYSSEDILGFLEPLIYDQNPLIQTSALYLISQLDIERSKAIARDGSNEHNSPLFKETAKTLLSLSEQQPPLVSFPVLEKVVYLFNSNFFNRMQSETLIALANRAEVKTYSTGEVITDSGDTCRELLLLMAGDAKIHFYSEGEEVRVEKLPLGQTLDELEVLTRSDSKNTIIADDDATRILAISVDTFDEFLDRDPDFARRVLEMESQQLQRFMEAK